MSCYVRVLPYNKAKRHKVRRYNYMGERYDAERGWYEVDESKARLLAQCVQDETEPDSPPVFEILTEKEFDQEQKRQAQRLALAAAATEPDNFRVVKMHSGAGDLSTKDLRGEPETSAEAQTRRRGRPPKAKTSPDSVQ